MSCVPVIMDDGIKTCANCGKQGSDSVVLKNCTACRLVKYCGVDCQRAHRKQHKKACKQRAAELKDEQLFGQGKRGMKDCPFCRTRYPCNDADALAMVQTRVSKKDPVAINHFGECCYLGMNGQQKDVPRAITLWKNAAELGSIDALYNLGIRYANGDGVEQDKAKAVEFYKKAAMQGSAAARHNLGCIETEKGNYNRAVRHLLISAKMGDNSSVDYIKRAFKAGLATKEQYAQALKGHREALEEMKSHDRDEAKRLRDEQGLRTDYVFAGMVALSLRRMSDAPWGDKEAEAPSSCPRPSSHLPPVRRPLPGPQG
ncbi:hypothetical protein THAOC_26078, partial [Thalassiosira oceanica]